MASSNNEDRDQRGHGDMQDDALEARLKDLGGRISRVSKSSRPQQDAPSRGNAMGLAFRLATELVVGLVVGGLIGWVLDKWLGTSPLMLLLFFALGAAAGILNVIRTARQMQQQAVAQHGWGKDVADNGED